MASSGLKLSIVYITKRPGSYDILFNSILQQNDPLDYELICIDDALPLAKRRAAARSGGYGLLTSQLRVFQRL